MRAPGAAGADEQETAVGRVLGSPEATPLEFSVAVAPGQYLQLDDVVVTDRDVPGQGPVTTAGVVTQVAARHEGVSFASDVFEIARGALPALLQESAQVMTTRVDPETYVPPHPGAPVRRAVGPERDHALYFDQMEHRVPVGIGRDGRPVFVNLDFVDGTRGAHVNISGISGVATKTSFALFLLHSLFTGALPAQRALNSKALIFSVKGEDLLHLDRENSELTDEAREDYANLGLPAEPFQQVGLYAPPTPGDSSGRPHVEGRAEGITSFWWTIAEFCQKELLRYVFADAEDDRQQYTMVIHQVASQIRRAEGVGDDGAVKLDGQVLRTYADLVGLIQDRLLDEDTRQEWAGPAMGMGTVNAFLRRLHSSQKALGPIIRGDLEARDDRAIAVRNQVTVIDLHRLNERAQRFVVGVVLAQETARKEKQGSDSLLFTMIDELNKYAPREGSSPIAELLLDIAERGRSLGIILIGAQQTASEVERRIVSNCSIKVVGRLDPAEASRPEYGFLPASQRQRALLAKPGTMFVSQPELPVPLTVNFPFPAWATRASEVQSPAAGQPPSEEGHGDPFAGLPAAESDRRSTDPTAFGAGTATREQAGF